VEKWAGGRPTLRPANKMRTISGNQESRKRLKGKARKEGSAGRGKEIKKFLKISYLQKVNEIILRRKTDRTEGEGSVRF